MASDPTMTRAFDVTGPYVAESSATPAETGKRTAVLFAAATVNTEGCELSNVTVPSMGPSVPLTDAVISSPCEPCVMRTTLFESVTPDGTFDIELATRTESVFSIAVPFFLIRTRIVVVPSETPVTIPSSTVAICVLSDDHVVDTPSTPTGIVSTDTVALWSMMSVIDEAESIAPLSSPWVAESVTSTYRTAKNSGSSMLVAVM